ncbi:hypothetical protein S83_051604, partial [Arachis hypogaea]
PNVPHLSHFTVQRHPIILTHGHIQVEATYTRYSGKRDGSFGVISGGWEIFASLCNFKPGGVGVFEVISNEPVTIIQIQMYETLETPRSRLCPLGKEIDEEPKTQMLK